MRLEFLLDAEEELIAAANFYEAAVTGLGREFLAEVHRTCQLISRSPATGIRLSPHVRRRLVRRFPYYVVYGTAGDKLVILAIAHQHRRPGYWRHRS